MPLSPCGEEAQRGAWARKGRAGGRALSPSSRPARHPSRHAQGAKPWGPGSHTALPTPHLQQCSRGQKIQVQSPPKVDQLQAQSGAGRLVATCGREAGGHPTRRRHALGRLADGRWKAPSRCAAPSHWEGPAQKRRQGTALWERQGAAQSPGPAAYLISTSFSRPPGPSPDSTVTSRLSGLMSVCTTWAAGWQVERKQEGRKKVGREGLW